MKGNSILKLAVNAYYAYEDMRVGLGNRMKKKKDGSDQIIPESQKDGWSMTQRDLDMFKGLYKNARNQEAVIFKYLKGLLPSFRIWTEWLKNVKGVGVMMGSVIIAVYNIDIATTISKLWQYTGLNPGMVRGKKRIPKHRYKKKDGEIIKEIVKRDKSVDYIVLTNDMVRGDETTDGYIRPYNAWARAKMVGVLGPSFMTSHSPYAKYFYDKRTQLENSSEEVRERIGNGKVKMVQWKDARPDHRRKAAMRYMIKMFLKDLYVAWRTLEGLEVRAPYQEEYLGHTH